MPDCKGNQYICIQIGVAVGMQVCGQFYFLWHIGFYQCFPEGIFVVLCLAHQCFGNGRDKAVHLNCAVRIYVGQLCAALTQYVHTLAVPFDIAGNIPFNNGFSVFHHSLLPGYPGQIVYKVV